jgi:hypothetical protein
MRNLLLGAVLLVACGSDNRTNSDAPIAGDAAGDGAHNTVCGGPGHVTCGATEYCDYADNGCGIGDRTGSCQPRPELCPAVVGRPVCACDGKVYAGECVMNMAGFDLDAHGICAVQPGRFACGYTQCELATQYCLREPHAGAAETFSCVTLPLCASQPASCTCLAGERCGSACTGDATVGLTLTCP